MPNHTLDDPHRALIKLLIDCWMCTDTSILVVESVVNLVDQGLYDI